MNERTRLIRSEISKHTGLQVANDIPSVAVSNTRETKPNGKKWLAKLYTQVFVRASKRGTILFILATMDSIKQRVSFNNSQKALITTKFAESIITYTGIGISIGSVFGGVIGGSVGGVLGSLIGFWRSQLSD